MLVEVLTPLKIRFQGQILPLRPGHPIDLPEENAQKLLAQAPGKVRVVSDVVLESAVKSDGTPLSPVYWEAADGRILGPAVPESVAKVGHGERAQYWVIVTYQGLPRWVNSDQLRSRQAFEQQTPVQVVDLIREVR